MKIAYFGTPDFSAQILERLYLYDQIDIKLVVSQPDKAIGRKKVLTLTPVKLVAHKYMTQIKQPEKIKKNTDFHSELRDLNLDFIVVVAYGKIVPKEILDIPKYGCINIHGSLLPKYRGASPVQMSIKNGDTKTGLTIMFMSEGMDEGDIISSQEVVIGQHDTSIDIFEKFVDIGPELLVRSLKNIYNNSYTRIRQDDNRASYCGKIEKSDGEVSFQKQSASEIYNSLRAYTPWPGIYSYYKDTKLTFSKVYPKFDQRATNTCKAGTIIREGKNTYYIICSGNSFLEIVSVQLAGKKEVPVKDFVNGNPDFLGYRFD